jgi:hypothetical protein
VGSAKRRPSKIYVEKDPRIRGGRHGPIVEKICTRYVVPAVNEGIEADA